MLNRNIVRVQQKIDTLLQTARLAEEIPKPSDLMRKSGMEPDPWQADLLDSPWMKALLLIHRQAGKSTATAALGLDIAINKPGSTVLITAPSQRQAKELFDKIKVFYYDIGSPHQTENDSATLLKLSNGSKVHSLHGSEKTLRGISAVDLAIVDEASRVDDALFTAISPMLAVSGGRLVLLTTPWGKRGYFYDQWIGPNDWKRVKITADKCPRITPEFLAEERASMSEAMYRQEYFCEFVEAIDAVFRDMDIERAKDTEEMAWQL